MNAPRNSLARSWPDTECGYGAASASGKSSDPSIRKNCSDRPGDLNGPNLNRLGKRQPHIYGHETLADVEKDCRKWKLKLEMKFHQSNREYVAAGGLMSYGPNQLEGTSKNGDFRRIMRI
jgi:Dehydroquinase class II